MKQMPALRDEETIVWEGHPDTGLSFGIGTLASGIFAGALVLACLGLATVIDRAYAGSYWSTNVSQLAAQRRVVFPDK